jgi:hypothetical protein
LIHTVSNRFYLQGFATTGLLTVGLPVAHLPLVYMITGAFAPVPEIAAFP